MSWFPDPDNYKVGDATKVYVICVLAVYSVAALTAALVALIGHLI